MPRWRIRLLRSNAASYNDYIDEWFVDTNDDDEEPVEVEFSSDFQYVKFINSDGKRRRIIMSRSHPLHISEE